MICKYLLSLSSLSFRLVHEFVYCTEAFSFNIVLFLLLLSLPSKSDPKQINKPTKNFAKTNVKELTACFKFYIKLFNPFSVNFYIWYKIVVQFQFFACSYLVFSAPFIEETICLCYLAREFTCSVPGTWFRENKVASG